MNARASSIASLIAATAARGPSRTRLGTSTMRSTRNLPSSASTVAFVFVPPTSRPTTTAVVLLIARVLLSASHRRSSSTAVAATHHVHGSRHQAGDARRSPPTAGKNSVVCPSVVPADDERNSPVGTACLQDLSAPFGRLSVPSHSQCVSGYGVHRDLLRRPRSRDVGRPGRGVGPCWRPRRQTWPEGRAPQPGPSPVQTHPEGPGGARVRDLRPWRDERPGRTLKA